MWSFVPGGRVTSKSEGEEQIADKGNLRKR